MVKQEVNVAWYKQSHRLLLKLTGLVAVLVVESELLTDLALFEVGDEVFKIILVGFGFVFGAKLFDRARSFAFN